VQSIQVDAEVFAVLQKNAKPFLDTPNTTLRRLLGVDREAPSGKASSADEELEALLEDSLASQRTKAPKANLKTLIRAGYLREGERLHLVDYQGKRVPNCEAMVSGASLTFKGQSYTMSNLAQELLVKVGFKSTSVRGPSHWVTSKNLSVTALWQQFQEQLASK
jgi:hypothetical protein